MAVRLNIEREMIRVRVKIQSSKRKTINCKTTALEIQRSKWELRDENDEVQSTFNYLRIASSCIQSVFERYFDRYQPFKFCEVHSRKTCG
jgi:hypothetical protein